MPSTKSPNWLQDEPLYPAFLTPTNEKVCDPLRSLPEASRYFPCFVDFEAGRRHERKLHLAMPSLDNAPCAARLRHREQKWLDMHSTIPGKGLGTGFPS